MSATDELRRLLDERGVEYDLTDRLSNIPLYQSVTWWFNTADKAEFREYHDGSTQLIVLSSIVHATPEQAIEATLGPRITGETSDGFHTFNELYHHRAVLFSVIVRDHNELAWKSKLHHDGTMYDGMFIVGIETPQGQATYHYDIDPYWDMFDCKELERAPEWDGHSPDDAIERIATLGLFTVQATEQTTKDTEKDSDRCGTCRAEETDTWECVCDQIGRYGKKVTIHIMECSACGQTFEHVNGAYEYCPHCRRRLVIE